MGKLHTPAKRFRTGVVVGAASGLISALVFASPAGSVGGPAAEGGGDGPQMAATYAFTGDAQSFTVPAGVVEVEVVACGAQGGSTLTSNAVGGLGGEATRTITVTPGEQLTVMVGGAGARGTGGFNGGGSSLIAGGGGASDVRRGGSGLEHRVVIGGGGGGASLMVANESQLQGRPGGSGGGVSGGAGGEDFDGGGGTATEGGRAGSGNLDNGEPGQLGVGGSAPTGGGGGGGLYGGGGGGQESVQDLEFPLYSLLVAGAGGGGSGLGDSFAPASCVGDGTVVISHDEPARPTIVPLGVTVNEGDDGTVVAELPVSMSGASSVPVTVEYTTVGHMATAGDDYVEASGTVTFAPGETGAIVSISVLGDVLHEEDEILLVEFRNPTNATVGGFFGLGFVTIADDDPEPVAVPWIGTVVEGDAGEVTVGVPVRLSAPSGLLVTLEWRTHDLSASAPGDYAAAEGTLTIEPGATTGVAMVTVEGDVDRERLEAFLVSFRDPVGATLGGFHGLGAGLIIDDD